MSNLKSLDFKEPIRKIMLADGFKTDPNYVPKEVVISKKHVFKGQIARFSGMINQNLFKVIKEDLYNNLYCLYSMSILRIT